MLRQQFSPEAERMYLMLYTLPHAALGPETSAGGRPREGTPPGIVGPVCVPPGGAHPALSGVSRHS